MLQGEFKGLKVLPLVKCVAQSLVRVNEVIVNLLKTGERLDDVKMKFQQLVAPAVAIHQHCDISKSDALTRLVFIIICVSVLVQAQHLRAFAQLPSVPNYSC